MLTSEEIRNIGEAVKIQLTNVRSSVETLRVVLLDSTLVRLGFNQEGYYSLIVGFQSTQPSFSSIPQWISVSNNNGYLCLDFPEQRLAEVEYLLRKTIENFLISGNYDARDVLFAALNDAFQIWTASGEPMTKQEQIGLIGEMNTILSMASQFSIEKMIEGWDETSRRKIDFVFDDIELECKTIGPESGFVESSSLGQFVSENYPILLAITEVSSNGDSQILPDIIQSILDEIGVLSNPRYALNLRNKITSRYPLLLNHREYYHSTWKITNFSCKVVNADSSPASFPKQVPADIEISKFKFNFTELGDFDN